MSEWVANCAVENGENSSQFFTAFESNIRLIQPAFFGATMIRPFDEYTCEGPGPEPQFPQYSLPCNPPAVLFCPLVALISHLSPHHLLSRLSSHHPISRLTSHLALFSPLSLPLSFFAVFCTSAHPWSFTHTKLQLFYGKWLDLIDTPVGVLIRPQSPIYPSSYREAYRNTSAQLREWTDASQIKVALVASPFMRSRCMCCLLLLHPPFRMCQ